MQSGHVPSSHGSLEEEDGGAAGAHDTHRLGEPDDDGFDSEEFREYLATRNQRRSGRRGRDRGGESEDERGDRVVAPDRHHPNGMVSLLGFRTGSSKRDYGWQLPE